MSDKSDNIDKRDDDGWTPLMLEVLRGELERAESLIIEGANPNVENNIGETPLWIAIEEEHHGMVEMLCRYADVNYKNKDCATALARAMYQENTSIIELLIENGGENSGPIVRLDEEERIYTVMCKEYSLGKRNE